MDSFPSTAFEGTLPSWEPAATAVIGSGVAASAGGPDTTTVAALSSAATPTKDVSVLVTHRPLSIVGCRTALFRVPRAAVISGRDRRHGPPQGPVLPAAARDPSRDPAATMTDRVSGPRSGGRAGHGTGGCPAGTEDIGSLDLAEAGLLT
ncbi:hypothetical protein GCM10027168_20120 [Streptomyces capparidis]